MLYFVLDIRVYSVFSYNLYYIYCVYTYLHIYRSCDPVPQGQERLRQDPQRVRLQPRLKGK